MPITYQRLGNSGGGMVDLKITTYPNTLVKLQNEKVNKSAMSDESGVVIFKGLKGGTYTATAKGKTKEIKVMSEQNSYLCEQVKDLPIGAKIKFSSGKKYTLKIKNPTTPVDREKHQPNVAGLFSDYIVDSYTLETPTVFQNDAEWQSKLVGLYEELSWQEKSVIKSRIVQGDYSSGATSTYFYMPSSYELNTDIVGDYNKHQWGFSDDNSRVRKYENGESANWAIRNMYMDRNGSSRANIGYIYPFGRKGSSWVSNSDVPVTYGIVPACDISQDAYVTLDSDGYYKILGM